MLTMPRARSLLLTWIFWTGGAAALTAALGGGLDCNNAPFAYCGQLNALEAFAWMEWCVPSPVAVCMRRC
jgi:hypothetical protein